MIRCPVIRGGLQAVLLAALTAATARAADEASSPVVRSGLAQPEAKLWVGQRVILTIDVLSSDGWANLPSIPRIRVPGTIAYPSGGSAVRLNETINGKTCSGQRYEFWIYPQRAGRFTIPAIELTVSEKVFGAGDGDRSSTVRTSPVFFACEEPPGWDPGLPLVTSTSFEATQAWTPEVDTASTGDGITRTFTMRGADIPGMALPPLTTPPIAAVRAYSKQPRIDDKLNRGSLRGRRSQAETLVFQGEGQFELPEIVLQWWNPNTETLQTISLPGRTIAVTPALRAGSDGNDPSEAKATLRSTKVILGVGALILLGLLAWAWSRRKALRNRWLRYQSEKAHSERAYFLAFEKAAAKSDPSATLNALLRWLDRVTPSQPGKPPLLSDLVTRIPDEGFARELEGLLSAVNGAGQGAWHGERLRSSLRSHRRKLCAGTTPPRSPGTDLPPLNPQART